MNLTYQEAENYLFTQLPVFEQTGGSAYKPGVQTALEIDRFFNSPHQSYKTIHIAGTNGKGSVSNFLASILQEAGYTVGLFTSPHIVDFKERIRINGKKIDEQYVTDFVNRYAEQFNHLKPTFFELTTALAFEYFRYKKVDIAVIEVGMGGRLDSTNIITPILSVITNIALDHTQFLGSTLKEIAAEKAGIIKRGVPVVVGEGDSRTNPVFLDKAELMEAPIILASNKLSASSGQITPEGKQLFNVFSCGEPVYRGIKCAQLGVYQQKNIVTAIAAVEQLRRLGLIISDDNIYKGFENVNSNTGFFGRWQVIAHQPLVVCDSGHNPAGITYVAEQLNSQPCRQLRMVIGFVQDKDVNSILKLLPKNAVYYFVNAANHRALPANDLCNMAQRYGLSGKTYSSVADGFAAAKNDSAVEDFIFLGGSNYVIAEVLS
ncbi:MAG: bifunctional folylpolyglutamate synthase/dihydrofolate synthase [Bacteroidales bacterium]|nr:bifunctional folylpolyglutamate synthase/dihydrofolate synthase [Bacteroidales bacterium]